MERIIDETELPKYLVRMDYILDVRTPLEFEEDHIPGAINVPVLNNEQRAEVGTLFKENAFEARKLGASYAIQAIHGLLASPLLANMGKGTRLLVYCARGGQRSGSLAAVLGQIGFPVFRLCKGYKSYRAYVLAQLERLLPKPVVVLYGYTGSGKTRILEALSDEVNVLDLEGLARHRGSLLGDLPGQVQPTQRAFESALVTIMLRMHSDKPCLIEGESRMVGKVMVPQQIWEQMRNARQLWLEIPRACRIEFILHDYHELKESLYLEEPLNRLARYLSTDRMTQLRSYLAKAQWAPFVSDLLEFHYDPLYANNLKAASRERHSAANTSEAIEIVRQLLIPEAP